MTPILELQDLSFRYEGGLPGEKVLDALTFAVAPGERVGLVGCNGVGKSTLLKVLVGILPIQAGALTVGGLPMERKNLAEIRRKVGYIFQDSDSQLFMPTVRADVAFAAENYGYPPEEVAARTRRALAAVHMEHCADRPVYRLSRRSKEARVHRGHPDAGPRADPDGRAVRGAGPPQPAGAHRHFERTALREADCVPRPGFHLRHLRPGAAFAPRPARRRRPRAGDFVR